MNLQRSQRASSVFHIRALILAHRKLRQHQPLPIYPPFLQRSRYKQYHPSNKYPLIQHQNQLNLCRLKIKKGRWRSVPSLPANSSKLPPKPALAQQLYPARPVGLQPPHVTLHASSMAITTTESQMLPQTSISATPPLSLLSAVNHTGWPSINDNSTSS